MARYDIHVVPQGEQWAVLREGDDRPVSLHDDEADAERTGRQLAADGGVAFGKHRQDRAGGTDRDDPRLN
jgi:hypothetical protein